MSLATSSTTTASCDNCGATVVYGATFDLEQARVALIRLGWIIEDYTVDDVSKIDAFCPLCAPIVRPPG